MQSLIWGMSTDHDVDSIEVSEFCIAGVRFVSAGITEVGVLVCSPAAEDAGVPSDVGIGLAIVW